jgi:hypothetical protein
MRTSLEGKPPWRDEHCQRARLVPLGSGARGGEAAQAEEIWTLS